jgi:uncharacterized protein involved in exopolysaccharide biosynthesis/Mrp family chromosome partitioning ATPase
LSAQAPQAADREKVMSEIQIILSRGLADKAVRELHLEQRSEFNSALETSGLGAFRRALSSGAANQAEIMDRYYSRLNVYQVGTSRVIAIEFSSYDPVLARDAANRIADLYIEGQREARLAVNGRAADWLSQQIDMLRQRVAESEAKVEEYRAKNGLLEANGATLQAQQLSELNSQLSAARAAKAEAEARASVIERASNSDADDAASTAVLSSPLIQTLRAQEVQLKRELSEMSAQLLPTHPRMIQKQAELTDLQSQIRNEIGKVLSSVRTEAQVAAAREESLQRDLARLESRRVVSDRDQIQLRALEREAAANRGVLENFLTRYTEISTRGNIAVQEANARVISRAQLPDGPSFPEKTPMLVLAGLVSLFGGLIAVFVAELMDHKIRHLNDIEKASGVPVLASVPSVPLPQDEPMRRPGGAFAESIRSIQAGLGIIPAGRGRRGKIVAVTSTSRGEGRTTTAIALARSMAQSGLRVLLIDADLRQPDLQYILDLPPSYGFTDLVTGRAGFRQVITRDAGSSAHVICSGSASGASAIRSPRLMHVMYGLVNVYDAVIFDCGPSSAAETQTLMRLADHCVYAVRWNATERDQVVSGVRRLAATGMRADIGLVITQTDRSSAA